MTRHPRLQQRFITLFREELLHDIQFEAWKISRTHIDNQTLQLEHQVNEDADDWIERKIESAIDKIYEKMSFALIERATMISDRLDDIPTHTLDDAPRQDGEDISGLFERPERYEFLLALDPQWNGSLRAIRGNMHEFIVAYALGEWFNLTLPDKAQFYLAKSAKMLDNAASACRVKTLNQTFRL